MVSVLTQKLHKELPIAEIGVVHENMRLRLAAQAAAAAVFDWHVPDGSIVWDGALQTLPLHLDNSRAQTLIDSIPQEKRRPLQNILDTRSPYATTFQLELEIASAMGPLNFTMMGSRMPGEDGRTERLVGLLRETTERARVSAPQLSRHPRRTHRPSQPQRAPRGTGPGHRQGQGRAPPLRLHRRLG